MLGLNKVYNMDCIEGMRLIDDNSIDSIVTDPPYELGFMGKSWDNTGISNNKEMWAECLRILKPGGYLLSFGGTRTYHRMAVAIEDAGFEVRDMIEWVYGSGFPKSLNIGKAVDKLQGNEKFREKEIEFVKWLKSNLDCYWCSGLGVISDNEEGFGDPSSCLDCGGKGKYTMEDVDEWLGTKAQAFHFFAESDSNRQIPNTETYTILKSRLHLDDRYDDFVKKHSLLLEEIREVQGYEKSIKNWDKKYNKAILNKPKTELASEWEGWGTALKPAHEPICMARKPLAEKTVAENCLKYGTGGINIDESRVGTEERTYKGMSANQPDVGTFRDDNWIPKDIEVTVQGRFPANLIHDNSEEVRECFPESKGGAFPKTHGSSGFVLPEEKESRVEMNDSGNASRFFKSIIYQAKASKSERNKGLDLHKLISIMGLDLSSNNPLGSTEQPDQNQLHLLDIDLSPQKEGSECEIKIKKGKDLSMSLYEKLLTDQYLNDYKSTIKTTTNGTTTLTTLNWLRHCITKEYIADVNGEIEFGESLVEIVEGGKKSTTTIKGKLGYLLGVKNVVAEMQLIIKEKENKNHHSTVKPIALMEYLIKMVTPKCGVVLDPFMGSGTTGCASKKNGYNYIGFELDKGYREIANKRIQSIQSQLF